MSKNVKEGTGRGHEVCYGTFKSLIGNTCNVSKEFYDLEIKFYLLNCKGV